MFEIQLVHFSYNLDTSDPRNAFHDTALREARIATDYRQIDLAVPQREGFLSRLRLAVAGSQPSASRVCACAA